MSAGDSLIGAEEDRKARERVYLAYRDTFETPAGQVVLVDLRRAFYDRLSFTPGDPYRTAFNEGRRDVVLGILQLIETASTPESDKPAPEES